MTDEPASTQLPQTWRNPRGQRIVGGVVGGAILIGVIVLLFDGYASTWQPWLFVAIFIIGLMRVLLPKTVLRESTLHTRSAFGISHDVELSQLTEVGYGPLGLWVRTGAGTSAAGELTRLHAITGQRPALGLMANSQGGPAGAEAVRLIVAQAARNGAQVSERTGPGIPPRGTTPRRRTE